MDIKKLALTVKLLYRLMTIGLLCLFADVGEVSSAETAIRIVQNGILKGNLMMQFQVENLFNEKVIRFLNRGFTVRVEYNIELWQNRNYWFDRLSNQHSISYQLNFKPVEKQYTCIKSQKGITGTSRSDQRLDNIIYWVTRPDRQIIIPIEQLDPNYDYYYNIEVLIATLTTKNVEDLQRWLGEFDQQAEEPSSIAKTSFKIVADFLSSKNNKKFSFASERFYLHELPKLDK